MAGSGSPCGACKFLRRKCVSGCVFAPYFCHEQGASHFAAIHKVFGASNVSKLLANIPVSDRCEAAVTISYEAQARLQDPIYGCVSHIFALQQQVVNLQAQLATLKELQAAQSFPNGLGTVNPNGKFCGKVESHDDDDHQYPRQDCRVPFGWFELENSNRVPQINSATSNLSSNFGTIMPCYDKNGVLVNPNYPLGNKVDLIIPDENISYGSFEDTNSFSMSSFESMQPNNRPWAFQEYSDEFQSTAFAYVQNS
ncbi:Lateral organ boundaries domain containing protein [Parasponia andersonii]|uniref:Lateral organ boundaries domain containing protein n=1 Tax=Parasponia andersonii TaxID=3476 RepID=A0A2P5CNF7_PARAD|nr:Lateral organ boundaries domain containing protein [Parasponia andersonii]